MNTGGSTREVHEISSVGNLSLPLPLPSHLLSMGAVLIGVCDVQVVLMLLIVSVHWMSKARVVQLLSLVGLH